MSRILKPKLVFRKRLLTFIQFYSIKIRSKNVKKNEVRVLQVPFYKSSFTSPVLQVLPLQVFFNKSSFYKSSFYKSSFYKSSFYKSSFYKSSFYKSSFYKSSFYKSSFYKSSFYKSSFYKSSFYKSSFYPVQSSLVQSSPVLQIQYATQRLAEDTECDSFSYQVYAATAGSFFSVRFFCNSSSVNRELF